MIIYLSVKSNSPGVSGGVSGAVSGAVSGGVSGNKYSRLSSVADSPHR